MEAMRSWWQHIRKHWIVAIIISFVIAAMVLILVESLINGTGFNGYDQVTIAHTISGPSAGTVVRTEVSQPGKTLWDWLQLLIIPTVIAVGGYVINLTISRGEQEATKQRAQSERETAEKRAETERKIAEDNQRETALQKYIDNMSELLFEKKLRDSKPEDDEARKIARVRTLTVLPRLDRGRKRSVLQFLYESDLIDKDMRIIDLDEADLSGADLSGADLKEADLSRADLGGADLSGADLSGANLSGANLSGANLILANLILATLREANLGGADLSRADLGGADLSGANLREACLSGANLPDSTLREADLSGADLSGATLRSFDQWEADLSEADLSGANLTGAVVTTVQLDKAKSLKGAIMPNGTIYD